MIATVNASPSASPVRIFVSYAREDCDHVHALRQGLEPLGVQVTGDWDLAAGSQDYEAELRSLILRSDAFLAVVTPDFIRSEACRIELLEATRLEKRLIGVLAVAVPDSLLNGHEPKFPLPDRFRKLQWHPILSPVALEPGVRSIIKSMHTDLALMQEHTRLLDESKQWQTDRDSSRLLRGRRLKSVRLWIRRVDALPADQYPKPTQLQREYILASVRASCRRWLIAVSALTVLAVAGVVAYLRFVPVFEPVDISPIANWPLDHFRNPPPATVCPDKMALFGDLLHFCNGLMFDFLPGEKFNFSDHKRAMGSTRNARALQLPEELTLKGSWASVGSIDILMNASWIVGDPTLKDKEVGEVVFEFADNVTPYTQPIVGWRNIREPWAYDDDEAAKVIYGASKNVGWRNLLEEPQGRANKSAKAFIDMFEVPLPDLYRNATLTRIVFRNKSVGPSLLIMAVTIKRWRL